MGATLAVLLAAVSGGAQQAASAAAVRELPADPRPAWRVAFAEWYGVGLAPENTYLGSSIPRLLIERLSPIRKHTLSRTERHDHARRIVNDALRAALRQLGELRERRSELLLQGADADALNARIAEVERRVERLRRLRSEPAAVAVAPAKPLRLVGPEATERLLPAPPFSALGAAEAADLDLIVTGELEEFDSFFYVEAHALDTAAGRTVLTVRDVLPRGGVMEALGPLTDELARLLIGQPWSVLTIDPSPAEAAVYVDGAYAGTGFTELSYQPLGPHRVRAAAPGHRPVERTVMLTASGLRWAPRLDPAELRSLTVTTDPPGAALYLDSRYAGSTPRTVDASGDPVWALVRLPDHHAAGRLLPPAAGDTVQFTLAPAQYDRAQWQRERRDRFYRRFGAAALSLAGPLILFGAAGDAGERAAAAAADPADLDGLLQSRDLLVFGGAAALAVSSVLIVRMAFALGDYLAATDRVGR